VTHVVCAPCGAEVENSSMPAHPYVPAVAGCWALFGEVQADEMTRFGYPPAHSIVVDAYMASHPGDGTDRREAQSVVVHLVGLCGLLENGWDSARSRAALRTVVSRKEQLPVLKPWPTTSAVNIHSMVGAIDLDDYDARARTWAAHVWQAWSHEHNTIRALLPTAHH
jgi:hypothetical protein